MSKVAVTREGKIESFRGFKQVVIAVAVKGAVTVRSESLVTCAFKVFAEALRSSKGDGMSPVGGVASRDVPGDRLDRNCSMSPIVVAIGTVPDTSVVTICGGTRKSGGRYAPVLRKKFLFMEEKVEDIAKPQAYVIFAKTNPPRF